MLLATCTNTKECLINNNTMVVDTGENSQGKVSGQVSLDAVSAISAVPSTPAKCGNATDRPINVESSVNDTDENFKDRYSPDPCSFRRFCGFCECNILPSNAAKFTSFSSNVPCELRVSRFLHVCMRLESLLGTVTLCRMSRISAIFLLKYIVLSVSLHTYTPLYPFLHARICSAQALYQL